MKRLMLVLALVGAPSAFAQGVQTGVLTGTVRSADGQTLPGVVVAVKSDSLQGSRSATTDANGGYILKGLPSGSYKVVFSLSGFATLERSAVVAVGSSVTADASMKVAAVEETITVTAEAAPVLTSSQVGADYKAKEIDSLATSRTLSGVAELAPGLTNNTPNGSQVTIAGNFAYDNVFLVDGVDVNDNLFGTPNDLFIEDAVEETQVLTSGITAEYGRFGGGVINTVTKRGGNTFTGSFRTDLLNPTWTTETPFEKKNGTTRKGDTNKIYSATLGGPIVKDKLWFFVAGRGAKTANSEPFPQTGIQRTDSTDNKREEVKLTGSINASHTLQGSFINNSTDTTAPPFDFSIEPVTVYTSSQPNNLFVLNYNGVLNPKLFVEAQYSEKRFKFQDSGGRDTNVVTGSPFITQGISAPPVQHFHAPYFDATDPEDRNNRQVSAAVSYYLSTSKLGKHDLKGGFENFRTTHTGGNSQSPTNFVFYTDYLTDDAGKPVLDDKSLVVPLFTNGQSALINYLASRGARQDITTNSFYLNDKWAVNGHLSASLGVRYERVRSVATGGIIGVDTDTIVPRLGIVYDVKADGRYTLKASYGHYAGKYNEAQFGNNTNVGNPNYTYAIYTGPSGQGNGFLPGFDVNNYQVVAGSFPTANVSFDKSLSAPVTKEFTVGAGMQLGDKGFAQGIYTHRRVTHFVEDFIDLANGSTHVVQNGIDFGTFDNKIYRNSDLPNRVYEGFQLQATYRASRRLAFNGHYTIQLKNDGNFEGENTNQPAITSIIGNYPELFTAVRNFPDGRLLGFQRHKVRAWATYDLGLGRLGDINVGFTWRFDSAQTFSLRANSVPLSAVQKARDPGYASPPTTQTLYFGDRGSQDFAGVHQFDVALNYGVPVVKSLRPWVKVELYNMLNNAKLTSFNTTVTVDKSSPLDANGLPTGLVRGPQFGQATSNRNFPQATTDPDGTRLNARTFRVSMGFRF